MIKWLMKIFNKKKGPNLREANKEEQRLITALHEAAHAVCAHHSKFHSIVSDIRISSDTTGEAFVALSRRKALEKGKPALLQIVTDHEVVIDAAIIFYAGFEAERIFCERNNIRTDFSHSINDYNHVNQLRIQANPRVVLAEHELVRFSNKLVIHYWGTVELVAQNLLNSPNGRLDVVSATELIQYGTVTYRL